MASKKISELTTDSSLDGNEQIPVVSSSTTLKSTISAIWTWIQSQSATWTETATFNKTAQASTAETIATFKVSDHASSLDIINVNATNSAFNGALSWGTQSGADPAFTTRSAGTRLVFYNQINGSNVDYALGFNQTNGHMWSSIASSTSSLAFDWFAGTTKVASLNGVGEFAPAGNVVIDGFTHQKNLSFRVGIDPASSGGVGLVATDHSGSNRDGLAIYGHDGISLRAGQVVQVTVTTAGMTVGTANGTSISRIRHGVATLVGGTVTVADTTITANSRIILTGNTDGGTPGFLRVSARVASTSFTITSSSGTDTSTVAYMIIEP